MSWQQEVFEIFFGVNSEAVLLSTKGEAQGGDFRSKGEDQRGDFLSDSAVAVNERKVLSADECSWYWTSLGVKLLNSDLFLSEDLKDQALSNLVLNRFLYPSVNKRFQKQWKSASLQSESFLSFWSMIQELIPDGCVTMLTPPRRCDLVDDVFIYTAGVQFEGTSLIGRKDLLWSDYEEVSRLRQTLCCQQRDLSHSSVQFKVRGSLFVYINKESQFYQMDWYFEDNIISSRESDPE